MAPILNSAIMNLAILESAILVFPLKLTHTCQDWFPWFAQKNLHSFILTELDDGSHLQFCHLGFDHLGISHLSFSSQTISHLPRLVPTICTKKPSFIHSDLMWWRWPSWNLPFWIQLLASWIQTPCSDSSLRFTQKHLSLDSATPLWLWLKLIHSFWLKLIHSHWTWWCQPSWILRFTQKHSTSTLTLTLTNSFWLKLIHSHWTWLTAILNSPNLVSAILHKKHHSFILT